MSQHNQLYYNAIQPRTSLHSLVNPAPVSASFDTSSSSSITTITTNNASSTLNPSSNPKDPNSSPTSDPNKNKNKNKNKNEGFPDSLQNFSMACFNMVDAFNFNEFQKLEMQSQLKNLILKAIKEKKMWLNNWEIQTLPIFNSYIHSNFKSNDLQLVYDLEKKLIKDNDNHTNINKIDKSSINANNKRPILDDITSSPQSGNHLYLSEEKKRRRLERFATNSNPNNPIFQNQQQQTTTTFKLDPYKHFQKESEEINPKNLTPIVGLNTNLEKNYYNSSSTILPTQVRPLKILNQTFNLLLEKFNSNNNKINNNKPNIPYNYFWNQFKSMRQDLTVQSIQNELTKNVYETHSKIAILNNDLNEFKSCLTSLKSIYSTLPNDLSKFEYLSYRILYFILIENFSEISKIRLSLNQSNVKKIHIFKSHYYFISISLELSHYIYTNNYHAFFKLYSNLVNQNYKFNKLLKTNIPKDIELFVKIYNNNFTYNENESNNNNNNSNNNTNNNKATHKKKKKYNFKIQLSKPFTIDEVKKKKYYNLTFFLILINFFLNKERIKTLSIFCKIYQKISTDFLITELSFQSKDSLKEFLSSYDLLNFIIFDAHKKENSTTTTTTTGNNNNNNNNNNNVTYLDCRQARLKVEEIKMRLCKKVDIKGQM
ncbi:Thp3p ASCRUDRAFT_5647 [Ascoidea rubescens DSM 1968]|uniref:SAC3/GANP/THP3 conserved domain-containing protein n=1 Tax=Ascoidea rubescens DSM 1968 TaxID=1344418 RepID=A0A1D2VQ26_9ASCO|nr:hypothetical protein ASCRUDRAFT_5647 [Ascoidea rubescens DSM 1968]ODV63699.1 hypothetical protein ASCRUDRAFT_5647 [Ascoidea rubescens DSM 1968]